MKSSLYIGSIKGIRIEINYSWFIIFIIVTWSMAASYYPLNYPDLDLVTRILLGTAFAVLFFLSVLLHELSHSLVSISLKVPVKKITLLIFGGASEMEKEPDDPLKELKIAIAGPAMSVLLFVLLTLLANLLAGLGVAGVVVTSISYLANINLVLGLFNLIPAFPLDGGRVLRSLIWHFSKDLHKATKIASSLGKVFGYLLIVVGVFLTLNGNLFNGIWLVFLGWMINQMSTSSYQSMVVSNIFDKIHVREFMNGKIVSVDSAISVRELIDAYIFKYKYTTFPVMSAGQVVGIINANSVKEVPRESLLQTTVGSIVIPITDSVIVAPDETVSSAMQKILGNGIGRVLVMEGGALVGLISKTDILNYLDLYNKLKT